MQKPDSVYGVFIDPGPEESGWCIIEYNGHTIKIHGANHEPNLIVLERVRRSLSHFASDTHFGVETISVRGGIKNQDTVDTAIWAGEFRGLLRQHQPEDRWCMVERRDVLHYHTDNYSAKKPQLNACLYAKYGGKGTKKKQGLLYDTNQHMRDAFAGATYILGI